MHDPPLPFFVGVFLSLLFVIGVVDSLNWDIFSYFFVLLYTFFYLSQRAQITQMLIRAVEVKGGLSPYDTEVRWTPVPENVGHVEALLHSSQEVFIFYWFIQARARALPFSIVKFSLSQYIL